MVEDKEVAMKFTMEYAFGLIGLALAIVDFVVILIYVVGQQHLNRRLEDVEVELEKQVNDTMPRPDGRSYRAYKG